MTHNKVPNILNKLFCESPYLRNQALYRRINIHYANTYYFSSKSKNNSTIFQLVRFWECEILSQNLVVVQAVLRNGFSQMTEGISQEKQTPLAPELELAVRGWACGLCQWNVSQALFLKTEDQRSIISQQSPLLALSSFLPVLSYHTPKEPGKQIGKRSALSQKYINLIFQLEIIKRLLSLDE